MNPSYIESNPNLIEIENKIFIKKNFISKEEYKFLVDSVKNLSEENWNTHPTESHEHGQISIPVSSTGSIGNSLIDLIIPKYWTNLHNTVNRIKTGQETYEFGWEEWNAAEYIALLYFGDFQGGNLRCFNSNNQSEYNIIEIETNTLYLLPLIEGRAYRSEKVTSGIKYSFVDWVYRHTGWAIL